MPTRHISADAADLDLAYWKLIVAAEEFEASVRGEDQEGAVASDSTIAAWKHNAKALRSIAAQLKGLPHVKT